MSIDHNVAHQLRSYYSRAYKQGQDLEYEYTFLECRKAVELILISLCEEKGISVKRSTKQIEKLVGLLAGELPRVVDASIRLIQGLGNHGAHHQTTREEETDKLFIEPCISATKSLIQWFCPKVDLDKVQSNTDVDKTVASSSLDITSSKVNSKINNHPHGVPQVVSTLRTRLREFVEINYEMGEEFKMGDLKKAFQKQNPNNSSNAIHGHTCFMTTNYPSRLCHHLKKDGSDDLMFRVSRGIYRRYDSSIDPTPLYHD